MAEAAAADSGEILVTAERRTGTLQTTPISVTALGAETIKQLQINRTSDLMRTVPSLVVAQGTVDPTTLTIFMRGAGQNAGTWLGFESAVGLYVDDTFFARLTGANLDLADIERIEVLRGPQGTLYGRNTLVGAIKYITKKPGETAFGDFNADYGSDNLVRVKGTVSAPISKDWAALVTGNYFHRDGYFHAKALGDNHYGDRTEYGGRAAIKYIGDGPIGIYATGFYSRSNNKGTLGLATNPVTLVSASNNIYDYLSPIDGFARSRNYGGDLTLSWKGDGIELKSISAYLGTTEKFRNDISGGQTVRSPTGAYLVGFNDLRANAKNNQFTQEFQALGDTLGGRLSYIGGLYYFHEAGTQVRTDAVLSTFFPMPQTAKPSTNSYAAYGQATFNLSDTLSAVGGLRYTTETKKVTGRTQTALTVSTYTALDGTLKAHAWTPKAGLNWKASDTTFLYASASRGFQGGGFNYLALTNPAAYLTSFDPETVWAYELGIKQQFDRKRGHINIAFYRNDFSDILTSLTVPTGSSLTQNAGKARVQGVEAELAYSPVRGLSLFATGAFGDDKYTKINPNSDAAKAGAKHIPNVAKWQYDVGFSGDLPTGPGNLLFGGDVSYISSRYLGGTNPPITKLDPHHITNAYIGFRPENSRLEFRVSAENLLKEKYVVYGNVLGTMGIRAPGEPQTFKASVSFSY